MPLADDWTKRRGSDRVVVAVDVDARADRTEAASRSSSRRKRRRKAPRRCPKARFAAPDSRRRERCRSARGRRTDGAGGSSVRAATAWQGLVFRSGGNAREAQTGASPDARPHFAGADRDRPRPRGRPRTAAAGRSPNRCRRSPRRGRRAVDAAGLEPCRQPRHLALAHVEDAGIGAGEDAVATSASSVAISASAAKPRAAAIGSVRKRLVAVVSTSRSPASRWLATRARAASPRRGSTRVCTKRSRRGAQACGVRPWSVDA